MKTSGTCRFQFLDDVRLKPHRTIIDETNEQTGDQTCGQAQVEDEFALGQTSSDGKETATQTCLQAGEQHLKDEKERAHSANTRAGVAARRW